MRTPELIILVGIPASGKTSFYRRRLAGEYLHVSLDRWRGKGSARRKEHRAILDGLAAAGEGAGGVRGVVVDNTNVTAETRRRDFEDAAEFSRQTGERVRPVAYFFDADLASCLARNAARPPGAPPGEPYHVPPIAIRRFAGQLRPPGREEGFEGIFRVRITGAGEFEVEEGP